MATRLRAQSLPRPVRVEGARLRCAPPKRLTSEEASVETGQMSNCGFPISNWVRCAREPLLPRDLGISGSSPNFPFCSVSFRNFPFRSVSFRPVPLLSGAIRSPSESRSGFAVLLQVNALPSLFALFAQFAAQNRKRIVRQGVTGFGSVAKRSGTLRFFPKLSVSFRPVPRDSGRFRTVVRGGRRFAGR